MQPSKTFAERRKTLTDRLRELSKAVAALPEAHRAEVAAAVEASSNAATELWSATDELAASEAKHRELLETLPQIVFEVDETGHFTFLNQGALELLGYPPDANIHELTPMDLIVPEDRAKAERALREKLTGERIAQYEYTFVDANARNVPVVVYATPVMRDGRAVGLRGQVIDISERKSAERRYEKLRQQIEFMLGVTGTGLDIIDSEFNIRYINDAWKEIYGEPEGRKCYDYYMGRDEPCPGCGIVQAMKTKKPVIADEVLLKEDGRAVQVTTIPFQDENGEWLFAEVNVDIADRKKAELALQESEKRYRMLFDNAPIGIGIADFEGNAFAANRCMIDLMGYRTLEEVQAAGVTAVYAEPARREQMLKELRTHGRVRDWEALMKRQDGSTYTALLNVDVAELDGQPVLFATARDISEKKAAEAKLQAAVTHSPIATLVVSAEGEIISLNAAAEKLTGYSRRELRTLEDCLRLLHPDLADQESARKETERVLMGKAPTIDELKITRKDGEKRTVQLHVSFFEHGHVAQMLDITEQVITKHALEASREELRELAARLSEAEEAERRRLSRELHDQIGQALTAVGINLNYIRGQMPDGHPDHVTARLDDALALVEETAGRIRDVMASLRPPVLDDYGLWAALRWFGKQFSERTGIEVKVEGAELRPRLRPEVETALFRITQEACTNVLKHSRATQVALELKEAEENTIALTISDNGTGFDPAAVPKRPEEAGWGLISMRERAAGMGGRLRIVTAPNQGTRIAVEISRPDMPC